MAEKARVFLVNPDYGVVENLILDASSVEFYDTTTLWCPSLNRVVGRYGTNHKSKVKGYGTFSEFNSEMICCLTKT